MHTPAPIPENEDARLRALHDAYLLFTSTEERFDNVVRLATHLLDTPVSLISLVAEDMQWFKATCGIQIESTPRDVSFCAHALHSDDLLIVPDTRKDPRFQYNPLVTGPPHVRFYAGAPLRLKNGHILGTLCILDYVPRELTQKQCEVLTLLARQVVDLIELRREVGDRRLLNKAAQQASHFIALLHNDTSPRLFNPALCRALDLHPDQDLPRDITSIFDPEDAHTLRNTVFHALETSETWSGELTLRGAHNERTPVQATVFALRDVSYIPRHVAMIMYDITEHKRLAELKDTFVSLVSHELRTPITSVYGSLRLLEKHIVGELPPAAQKLAAVATRNCERLIRLINDVLDLQKIKSGHLSLCLRDLCLFELLQDAVANVAPLAKESNVEICLQIDEDINIHADRDRIIQVLVNLLSNALGFSPDGEEIHVTAHLCHDEVRICVRDRGPGIDPEDVQHLFVPFQQLDQSDNRMRTGTGLGLVISQAIIYQHGGQIGVDPKQGRGATFWFSLPLTQAS